MIKLIGKSEKKFSRGPYLKNVFDFRKFGKTFLMNKLKLYVKYDDYTSPYLQFSPENIMEKFKKLIS